MKVLVVEDDRKLARFVAQALTEERYVVDVCRSGKDALEQCHHIGYALVILDWMLPDLDGISVCRELRRSGSTVPILMLTARAELGERVMGLDAGADDYLTKPFHLEELLARVRAAVRRGNVEPTTLRVGSLVVDMMEHVVHVEGARVDLTPREYGLLLLLARNAGRVVTRTEILAQVWQTTRDPGSNVIDVNVRNLREKLGTNAPALETVRGQGYRLALVAGEPT